MEPLTCHCKYVNTKSTITLYKIMKFRSFESTLTMNILQGNALTLKNVK